MSDLKEFITAGVHFGHKTSRWSPKMKKFIWGARNKVHLIDVSKTALLLSHACNGLEKVAKNGGKVLWIGTKRPAQATIKAAGEQLAMPSVYHRWIGGTLTNFEQVKKAITRLLHLRDVVKRPLTTLKKKEVVRLQKEAARLEKNVGGIVDLKFPPAAIVVVDAKKEQTAIKEATNLKIPVIAIVDTNTDPSGIDVVIPSNDDSPRAISFIINHLVSATIKGQEAYAKQHAAEIAKEKEKAREKKAKSEKTFTKSSSQAEKAIKTADVDTKKSTPAKKPEKIVADKKATVEVAKVASTKKPAAPAKKPIVVKKTAETSKTEKPAEKKKTAPVKKTVTKAKTPATVKKPAATRTKKTTTTKKSVATKASTTKADSKKASTSTKKTTTTKKKVPAKK